MANVSSTLSEHARTRPDATALRFPAGSTYEALTFVELEERANRFAAALANLGIGRNTRVLLLIPPGPDFITLWFALLKLGAIAVLIDPGMGKKRLLGCIADARPEAIIAVPVIHVLRWIYRKAFSSVRVGLTVRSLRKSAFRGETKPVCEDVDADHTGAIVFTTGATGLPKGVPYSHRVMREQARMIETTWNIRSEDTALAAFLPFSLFCIAMGTCCVLPAIDSRRPADVDPDHVLGLCRRFHITYSLGSPAFWSPVAARAAASGERISGLTRVLLFGAPVRSETVRALKQCLPENGEVFTPYGATEALPLTSISGSEILETEADTRRGAGVCVGAPLKGVEIRIVAVTDGSIPGISSARALAPGEIGEIIAAGPTVTSRYETRQELTERSKIADGAKIWHRMGDAGYLDSKGRLWFCGRVNHRVVCEKETLYSVCGEAIFNEHPSVARSALVGAMKNGKILPVVFVELRPGETGHTLFKELRALAESNPMTREIRNFFVRERMPVDFRHNAKIIREELAAWAEQRSEQLQ